MSDPTRLATSSSTAVRSLLTQDDAFAAPAGAMEATWSKVATTVGAGAAGVAILTAGQAGGATGVATKATSTVVLKWLIVSTITASAAVGGANVWSDAQLARTPSPKLAESAYPVPARALERPPTNSPQPLTIDESPTIVPHVDDPIPTAPAPAVASAHPTAHPTTHVAVPVVATAAPQAEVRATEHEAASPVAPTRLPETTEGSVVAPSAPVAPRVATVEGPAPHAPVRVPPSRSTIGEEARLLSAAHSALARGDLGAVGSLLQAHRNLGKGALNDESEVLDIELQRAKGDTKGARARAEAFVIAHPKTPLARRLGEKR